MKWRGGKGALCSGESWLVKGDKMKWRGGKGALCSGESW